MVDTQFRPNPATLAAQLAAAKKAKLLASKPKRPAHQRQPKPYTTQSAGYDVRRSLSAPPKKTTVKKDVEKCLDLELLESDTLESDPDVFDRGPDPLHFTSWMPPLEAFDIDHTPPLKRHAEIDEPDPTDALDRGVEFMGFIPVNW